MKTIKFIVFIELIAMFVTGASHLVAYFTKQAFPLSVYPMMFGIVLVCILLVIYVITPFGEWFLS
jgi:hypothetical protein